MFKHPDNYIDRSNGCDKCNVKPRSTAYRVHKEDIVCEKCYNKLTKKKKI